MGEEGRESNEGEKNSNEKNHPLSREGWIMLLSDENNKEVIKFNNFNTSVLACSSIIMGAAVAFSVAALLSGENSLIIPAIVMSILVPISLFLLPYIHNKLYHPQKGIKPLINTREAIISGELTDFGEIHGIWKEYIKKYYGKLLAKSEMDKEEKESKGEKDCPLSPTDWVMFLSGEIHHQEHTNNRDSSTPTIMLLLVTLVAFMNWMFAARITNLPVHNINSILSVLQFSVYILSAIFLVYLIYMGYRLLIYRPKTQKRIDALEKLRGEIISGKTDSQKISKEWEEIYRTLYPRKSRKIIT